MANESKRYVQRGTTVADKAKLKYNPTALKDEPTVSRNKSLSFREDLSPKTSTGGSGGSNLIPRNKVDMASGNRNIGSQASNAKNIVPRGTSQPGPVRPETPSSARTMKDVQGSSRTVNKALPKGSVGSTASKIGRGAALGRTGTGIGALLYSKNAGEGSDFKGKDRPAPYSGLKLTGYDIPKDFGMKNPSEGWEDKKQEAPKSAPKAMVKSAPKGESQSSKDDRWKAYEHDNPGMKKGGSACKGYAKGGSVKSSASSRGDGCATKGHTRGAMR
jgi:hypothetical protein